MADTTQAAERRNPHLQRRDFRKRFKDEKWVLIENDREEGRVHTQIIDAAKAEELLDDSFRRKLIQLDSLQTVKNVTTALADEWEWGSVIDFPTWESRRIDEERQNFESLAASIAIRYGVKVNSPEFLDACQSELHRFRSYREGMREDGLCIGYGVTPEQWHEERNESCSDSERIHGLMKWIESNLPLLFARWEESKLGDKSV